MFAVPYHSTFGKSVTTCDVLRTYPKKSIKYLYNYFSGTWIKVTSHANLGCYRVWGARRGAVGHARARRPCPAVTLRPWSRPPAPRAPRTLPGGGQHPHAHGHPPAPYLLAAHALHLVQNLIPTYITASAHVTRADLKRTMWH